MFVDMDGVIAEYDYCDKDVIRNNVPGVFLNKRPLKSIINILATINEIPNLQLYILSACNYNDQAKEKNMWLDEHANFFTHDRRIFVIRENLGDMVKDKNDMKPIYIEEKLNAENGNLAILIEDTHDILRRTKKRLGEKVVVFHVSSLVE